MLLVGLSIGILSALVYLFPDFLKTTLGFISLRPMHVSSAIFWILLGATGCIYNGLRVYTNQNTGNNISIIQWSLWIIAIIGVFFSYVTHQFGGREYWEFNPVWALPIALSWVLFLINFYSIVIKKIKRWPVYVWMWSTGIVFFLFTFTENYLWLFPYFRENYVIDTTIQWKVNGSLVGSWNQIIYGTAFFLMDRINGTGKIGKNKLAFAMFFLGLFNLMFNWGHHIYTLPTEKYIHYTGYLVSMTEWLFFVRILSGWKKSVNEIQRNYHYFPYRFLMASDIWVFLNMGQAILMSIPAINIYTHGTHVTVAHAMGTTIGINTMILLAACFEFLQPNKYSEVKPARRINVAFWILQASLLLFWICLNAAGIKKGIWQLSEQQGSYHTMMEQLKPYFIGFTIGGAGLLFAFFILVLDLLKGIKKNILIV